MNGAASFWQRVRYGATACGLFLLVGCGQSAAAPHSSANTASSRVAHHGHGAYITLSPSTGRPGTLVTLSGYLPSMAHVTVGPNGSARFQGNIGFGGFRRGLSISASSIHWSRRRPGHFTTQFAVPQTAWLTARGTRSLASGFYTVAIDCFGTVRTLGCAAGPDQAAARFQLTGGTSTAPTPHLTFSPSQAKPGETVKVSGWAPLTAIIGHPVSYQLTWTENGHSAAYGQLGSLSQAPSGRLSGSFTVPGTLQNGVAITTGTAHVGLTYLFTGRAASGVPATNAKGAVTTVLASTPFTVQAPLTWVQLSGVSPLREDVNLRPIAVAGSTIAVPGYTPGQFWLSHNGGGKWRSVSIAGVQTLSQQNGYPTVWTQGGKPTAYGVTLDGAFPSSYFVVVVAAQNHTGEIPPVYYTPYYTTNGGHTWHAVPVPQGFTAGEFGGFHVQGSTVYAEWIRHTGTLASEATTNGGVTWETGFIGCPQVGPCLRFGPSPAEDPGMGVALMQPVWRPSRQHQWVSAGTVNTNMNTSELVSLSGNQSLLVNAGSSYPVQLTTDGGRHWQDVALPTPPGVPSGGGAYQTILMMQNGDLLAGVNVTSGVSWYLLKPGGRTWQALPTGVLPAQDLTITLAGPNLWWFTSAPASRTNTAPVVHVTNDGQL